ncbi:MAG: sulfotransferase family protein [Wenzhouxiangella sp.]
MTVRSVSRSPVFILGIRPRSGTNYLFDLLRRHPDLSRAAPFFEDFLLFGAHHLRDYVAQVSSRWDPDWGVKAGHEAELLGRLGDAGLAFLEKRRAGAGTRLLSKTPEVANLDLFFQLFPDAKLIVLVRDGRAVTESALKSFDTSFEWQATEWAKAAQHIAEFQQRTPSALYRLLRYEDLVSETETQLRALLAYLELDPETYPFADIDSLPVRGSAELSVDQGSVHWQPVAPTARFDPLSRFAHWSDDQHRAFNQIAGDALRLFGYEPQVLQDSLASPLVENQPAPPAGDGPLLCSVNFEHFWHDEQLALIAVPPTEQRCLMPHQAVNALGLINEFRDTEHWEQALLRIGMPLEIAQDLQQDFLRGGLVLSAESLLERLRALPADQQRSPPDQRYLVIRTCDRPELLRSLLASARVNVQKHGLMVVVLDDSRSPQARQANAENVQELTEQAGIAALYVGEAAQFRLLRRLQAEFPEQAETIAYALAPRPPGQFSAGRLINLANLILAGQIYLTYDDDYLLDEQWIHPEVDINAAGITSVAECVLQGYDSRETMMQSLQRFGSDPFAEHLKQIGRPVSELLKQAPFATMNAADLKGLSRDCSQRLFAHARVLTTGNGALGRPIAPTARAGLEQQYRHTQPVWQAPKSYADWLRGHCIYKTHRKLTLQDLTVETPVAVDNSQLMPPTLPVGRREDTLFTFLIQHMHRRAMHLEMPWAIPHWREARDWGPATLEQADKLSLAFLLTEAAVPETRANSVEQKPEAVLRSIGALLCQYSSSGGSELREIALRRLRGDLSQRLFKLDFRLKNLPPEAGQVRQHLEQIIRINQQALQSAASTPSWEDDHIPVDPAQQTKWLAREFSDMGQLLQIWPKLWAFCCQNRDSILAELGRPTR